MCLSGGKLRNKDPKVKVDAVAVMARDSLETFMTGDWACITYTGSALLSSAFVEIIEAEEDNPSNPDKYDPYDEHLKKVFHGGMELLHSVLGAGYTRPGYHLAMESHRRPFVGGTRQSAMEHFQRY